jgi:hypothetical protein
MYIFEDVRFYNDVLNVIYSFVYGWILLCICVYDELCLMVVFYYYYLVIDKIPIITIKLDIKIQVKVL